MSGEENSRGFSLLETMTVICLILVLATIAEPFYLTIARWGREASLRDELFTMRSQIDRFTHDYERGPVSLDELVEKQYIGVIPRDPFTGSNETWTVEQESASISIDADSLQPTAHSYSRPAPDARIPISSIVNRQSTIPWEAYS